MLTFLFWNIHKMDNLKLIGQVVKEQRIDFLLLAESTLEVDQVLTELNQDRPATFHANAGMCPRITVYSKFSDEFIIPVFENHHISIRKLKLPVFEELLLGAVHLSSKIHQSDASQAFEATKISKEIARIEEELGHKRTILVGDFNMNPFEIGMIAASGLHATMDRKIAAKGKRKLNQVSYPFFYNPMWSLLGDASSGPPGTYYYWKSEEVAYFWNMFDQVLLRPEILPMFHNENLNIIEKIGDVSLFKKSGKPDAKEASDHFPVVFRLNC